MDQPADAAALSDLSRLTVEHGFVSAALVALELLADAGSTDPALPAAQQAAADRLAAIEAEQLALSEQVAALE